ncbi:hypothetical protein ACU4GD_07110 [Cupriavidus basilensis]
MLALFAAPTICTPLCPVFWLEKTCAEGEHVRRIDAGQRGLVGLAITLAPAEMFTPILPCALNSALPPPDALLLEGPMRTLLSRALSLAVDHRARFGLEADVAPGKARGHGRDDVVADGGLVEDIGIVRPIEIAEAAGKHTGGKRGYRCDGEDFRFHDFLPSLLKRAVPPPGDGAQKRWTRYSPILPSGSACTRPVALLVGIRLDDCLAGSCAASAR